MKVVSLTRTLSTSGAFPIGPAHLAFFGGRVVIFVIDALIPHQYMAEHHKTQDGATKERLMRTGLFVALGIGIHNFPEGMASWVNVDSRGKTSEVLLHTSVLP